MRVLYVCPSEEFYGDNKAILNLLPYLNKLGVEPYFLVRNKSPFYEYLKKNGYSPLVYYGFYSRTMMHANILKIHLWILKTIFKQKYIYGNNEYNSLKEKIKKIAPHLIHSNNGTSRLGYMLSKDLHIPHIWHLREYGDKDHNCIFVPSKWWCCRELKNKNNYSIAITDGIKEYFDLTNNVKTIYDGPLNEKTPSIIAKKEHFFLFVGRLTETKGVKHALNAFIQFKQEHSESTTKLYILGDGNDKYVNNLKDIAYKSGLGHSVCFLGYRQDVQEYMRRAQAIIIPSRFEAFGFITAEAMFNGCPVIGKDTGGTKEQMDNIDNFIGGNVCMRFNTNVELVHQLNNAENQLIDIEILKKIQSYVATLYSAKSSSQKVFDYYNEIIKHEI